MKDWCDQQLWANALSFDVSPAYEVSLGSGPAEGFPWLGTKEPLECTLVAIWTDLDDLPVIICTIDTLYPGPALRESILASVPNLPEENLWVCASHTHRAPMMDTTKPRLGRADQAYVDLVCEQVSLGIRSLLTDAPHRVTLEASTVMASHSVNRRKRQLFRLGKPPKIASIAMKPNPEGETDETVTVLKLVNDVREPICVIWSYACHPVGAPWKNAAAGHYPSVVRGSIRDQVSRPNLPVAFMQGFSGDTRPSATVVEEPKAWRRIVFGASKFQDMNIFSYNTWSQSLAEIVLHAFQETRPTGAVPVVSKRTLIPGPSIAKSLDMAVPVQSLALGSTVILVGISAEPVVNFSKFVREVSLPRWQTVMCVGCTDTPFGYLPTRKMLREGGYEARIFRRYFGVGRLRQGGEHLIKNVLASLVRD